MKSQQELFRRLEREVRTDRERLPIDAFLPPPETLPTDFPDPPPSAVKAEVREMGTLADAEEERKERRRQRRVRKPVPQAARNLEDEIHEFMNRDRPPGSRPEELSEFTDPADSPPPVAPAPAPEKK